MGHGTHWEAVLNNFDEDFATAIDLGIQNGHVIGRRKYESWEGPIGVQSAEAILIQNAPSGIGVLGVVVSAASGTYLHTAFPVAATGITHRVHILSVHESSFGLEACITASLGGAKINFFDPYYALCGDLYHPGAELDISLAGVCYLLAVPEPGQIVRHPEIGDTHLDGAAVLFPIDDPPPAPLPRNGFGIAYIQSQSNGPGLDDYHFRAPVKHIEPADFLTRPAWRLTATVLRINDGQDDIDIALYVLDDKIREGQPPSLGADVTGALWLQGTALQVAR